MAHVCNAGSDRTNLLECQQRGVVLLLCARANVVGDGGKTANDFQPHYPCAIDAATFKRMPGVKMTTVSSPCKLAQRFFMFVIPINSSSIDL